MRKILIAICLLAAVNGYGQNRELYHRVQVNTGKDGLALLAATGIAVDHGTSKKGVYFITDLSDQEIEKVKITGLSYSVLIEDVSAFYKARNQKQEEAKPTDINGCKECVTYPTPANFQLGSMGGFFTYQEMLNILDSMKSKYPALITAKQPLSATTTVEGRPVYYVKISDNPESSEPEPQALYTALHHAREVESLSQLIYYMWYLLEHYNTDAEIKYLVDHSELYFIPCVNPDGYVYNQTTDPAGGGMWRKNRRNNGNGSFGVDLNRNYGMFWGYDNQGSSPNGVSETFRGTAGFSEGETQMVRDFCNSHQFGIALNAHTYSNLLIYPYGHIPSHQTPDSVLFRTFAADMTECSHFLSGTGDQTVGYVTNGDSDDWMYGEQTTKNKIYALTPEAGDEADGFWPQSNRIIPIARQTMDQNLDVARLSVAYAQLKAKDGLAVESNDYARFDFQRTGLTNSNFSVAVVPISSNIAATGNPKTFNSPAHLQAYSDSISLTLAGGIAQGAVIKYALKWQNTEGYSRMDTVVRYYGTPDTFFYSNCDTRNDFATTNANTWDVTTVNPASGSGCLTDSPNGNYIAGAYNKLTTKNQVDLSGTSVAYLTFYARWDIEPGFDFVTVSASEDGSVYTPLCGLYTHNGNDLQENAPVYDGLQQAWVKEYINLQDYIGKKIFLEFRLDSDLGLEKDGFYLDDMTVLAYGGTPPTGIRDAGTKDIRLFNVPNPCMAQTIIHFEIDDAKGNYVLQITDQLGRTVNRQTLNTKGKGAVTVDVRNYANGIYFYKIASDKGSSAVKKMVVLH
jgi:carboxypeptidase T